MTKRCNNTDFGSFVDVKNLKRPNLPASLNITFQIETYIFPLSSLVQFGKYKKLSHIFSPFWCHSSVRCLWIMNNYIAHFFFFPVYNLIRYQIQNYITHFLLFTVNTLSVFLSVHNTIAFGVNFSICTAHSKTKILSSLHLQMLLHSQISIIHIIILLLLVIMNTMIFLLSTQSFS